MFSVEINEPLVTSTEWVKKNDVLPHEKVVVDRHNALREYLESLKPYAILPSIIICNETSVIIDGHHRFHALVELGFESLPVTKVNYQNKLIVTDLENSIQKKKIINAALKSDLLEPKTSFHHLKDHKNILHPIILISSLFKLDF